MDSELAEMAPAQVARRQMVGTMVKCDNIGLTFPNGSRKQHAETTSSSLSPSTSKSDCSTEVAESQFRTQPVATAVSATGVVDTTPTCTRAGAHFSGAHITVHNSHVDPHFSNVVTSTLAQGKRIQCRAFL